jgi:hypothetical protein
VETRRDESDPINTYVTSGISERHGSVPRWLVGVILALAVWMVYYLVRYWKPG